MEQFYLEELNKELEFFWGSVILFDQANSSSLPFLSSELNQPLG
jgi:hypothetical protein